MLYLESSVFKLARKAVSPIYAVYQRRLANQVKNGDVPNHLAVIMDGNRRYAQSVGLLPHEGHLEGKNTLEYLSDWCRSVGIKILTVYAFSLENFNRSEGELRKLMDLFEESFRNAGDDPRVHQHKIRVRALGHRELLPSRVKDAIDYAESKTKDYTNFNYNLAVAYGGRQEIIRSMRILGKMIEAGKLKADDIDADMISSNLYTSDLPDPDLILRTSGEERISNFLLWQLAYSELYFADVFWPDMRKIDFLRAIRSYQQRNRRLGK